ncbi:DUF4336 domain-containing protein [Synechococcus sp. MW101C3]|uniref:DUF4336 domain-containing protein n=1 Tax=Synechococcus sp. MW101C3 TaxID=210768 RepID=UPI000B99AEFF|nr:DUF4336 domain-containing protein [Synechococcus sp. MW101C3]
MLRLVATDLWVAEQAQTYFGLSIGARMSVIRLQDTGNLLVLSPIEPTAELVDALTTLGRIGHIVAPNSFHHLYANAFKLCFPQARFWGSAALKAKCPDLMIDQLLTAEAPSPWPDLLLCQLQGLNTMAPLGPVPLDEIALCHVPSQTLLLTDSAFNFDASFPWLTRFTTRIAGGFNRLEPTILERLASSDRRRVRASIDAVLAWDFDRVIVAHGAIVETGGKPMLAAAYAGFRS